MNLNTHRSINQLVTLIYKLRVLQSMKNYVNAVALEQQGFLQYLRIYKFFETSYMCVRVCACAYVILYIICKKCKYYDIQMEIRKLRAYKKVYSLQTVVN